MTDAERALIQEAIDAIEALQRQVAADILRRVRALKTRQPDQ